MKKNVIEDRKKYISMDNIARKYRIPRSSVQRILLFIGKQKRKRDPKEKINKNDKRKMKSIINSNIIENIKTSCVKHNCVT